MADHSHADLIAKHVRYFGPGISVAIIEQALADQADPVSLADARAALEVVMAAATPAGQGSTAPKSRNIFAWGGVTVPGHAAGGNAWNPGPVAIPALQVQDSAWLDADGNGHTLPSAGHWVENQGLVVDEDGLYTGALSVGVSGYNWSHVTPEKPEKIAFVLGAGQHHMPLTPWTDDADLYQVLPIPPIAVAKGRPFPFGQAFQVANHHNGGLYISLGLSLTRIADLG